MGLNFGVEKSSNKKIKKLVFQDTKRSKFPNIYLVFISYKFVYLSPVNPLILKNAHSTLTEKKLWYFSNLIRLLP